MVTPEECIDFCREEAERYRQATSEFKPIKAGAREGWQKRLEIFEMLEKAAVLLKERCN